MAAEVTEARVEPSEQAPARLHKVGGAFLEDIEADAEVALIAADAVETVADVCISATGGNPEFVVQQVELDAGTVDIAAIFGDEAIRAEN